jgi:hypothetical protein
VQAILWIRRPCAHYMILGGEAEEEAGEALCRTSSGPCHVRILGVCRNAHISLPVDFAKAPETSCTAE